MLPWMPQDTVDGMASHRHRRTVKRGVGTRLSSPCRVRFPALAIILTLNEKEISIMKVTSEKIAGSRVFTPFTISITLETEQEANALYTIFNYPPIANAIEDYIHHHDIRAAINKHWSYIPNKVQKNILADIKSWESVR